MGRETTEVYMVMLWIWDLYSDDNGRTNKWHYVGDRHNPIYVFKRPLFCSYGKIGQYAGEEEWGKEDQLGDGSSHPGKRGCWPESEWWLEIKVSGQNHDILRR